MLRRVILIGIALIIPMMSSAQKMLTASGEYTYYAPLNISPEQAEIIAIERAKISIIEKQFGTVVGVRSFTQVENNNGNSSVKFLSLGESEVKGEWIETIGDPVIKHEIIDKFQVVSVKITGKIREIKMSRVMFDSKILRNGIEDKYSSETFKDGDEFYVTFQSPVDGYVAIYLYDKDGVSRLLPLKHSNMPAYSVKHDEKYVFFANGVSLYADIKDEHLNSINAEYYFTCSTDQENNRFYIIFSPNKFTKAIDTISENIELPAFLDFQSFQKWLARCRKHDNEMVVKICDIIISK